MTDSNNFNTDIILNEIDLVIKKGLNTILKDYMNRYNLLENTHTKIMQLPSVLNELNKSTVGDSSDDDSSDGEQEDVPMFVSITEMTKNLIAEEVTGIEKKITNLEKKYDLILPIFDKILKKIDDLNEEVKCMKISSPNEVKVIKYDIKPVEKKENIKLEIQEEESEEIEEQQESEEIEEIAEQTELLDDSDDDEGDEGDDEEESDEEESDEEESEEEEQVEEQVVEKEEEEEEEEEEEDEQEVETETEAEEKKVETETKEEEEEEEEEELFEIEIDDTTYCTNNEESGFIFELSEDGDVGDKVGYFKEGEPFFYADEK
jgi:hypothetical protein